MFEKSQDSGKEKNSFPLTLVKLSYITEYCYQEYGADCRFLDELVAEAAVKELTAVEYTGLVFEAKSYPRVVAVVDSEVHAHVFAVLEGYDEAEELLVDQSDLVLDVFQLSDAVDTERLAALGLKQGLSLPSSPTYQGEFVSFEDFVHFLQTLQS